MTTMDLMKTSEHGETVDSWIIDSLVEELMEGKEWTQELSDQASEEAMEGLADVRDSERYNCYWDDVFNQELEGTEEVLSILLKAYEQRYNTSIEFIAWVGERSSHYGAIGGNGAKCTALKQWNTNKDVKDMLVFGDYGTDIELETGRDGGIKLAVSDHDGTNYCELVVITQSMIDSNMLSGEYYEEDVAERLASERTPFRISEKDLKKL